MPLIGEMLMFSIILSENVRNEYSPTLPKPSSL